MNYSGPQGYRDSTWIRPPPEIAVERADLGLDLGAEKMVYEGELARVRRENASLRDQLHRTLKELKCFQIKYPSEHLPEGDSEDLPPWVTSADVMTPLLRAYDSRIAELEQLVKQQATELENFHEKVEEILAENEALRETTYEQMRQGQGDSKGSRGGLGPMGPLNMELLNELNERVEILMTENALMVEQKAVMSKEMEDNLLDLEERTETVSKLSHQLGVISQDNKSLKQRVAQAEKDREEAANQTMKYSDSLAKAEIEISDLNEQLEVWVERCQRAESKVTQAEKDLHEAVSRADCDGQTSMRRMKAAEDYVKELQVQLLQKTQDLDSAQEVARKLKREYQSTRQDAEGMLQVMTGLERQLSEYSAREAEVERIAKDSKGKVEEALVVRDQAVTREEQLRREIARLHDDRKKHAMQKQSEIDAAVEVAKGIAANQIKSLEHDIEEMAGRLAKAKAEHDKAIREFKSAEAMLEKVRQGIASDRKGSEQAMRRLEERIGEVVIEKEDALIRMKAVQDLNTELRMTVDKLRTHEEAQRSMLEERDRSVDRELEHMRIALRDSQRECAEASKLASRRLKELEELQRDFDEKLHDTQKKKDDEVALYHRRATEAERNMKEMEVVANAEDHRVKVLVEQFKERSNISAVQTESKLSEYREKIKTLSDRNRELDSALRSLDMEKKNAIHQVEESKQRILRLQDQNREFENEVSDLTAQLASSLEAREMSARKAAQRTSFDDDNIDENFDVDTLLHELGEQ